MIKLTKLQKYFFKGKSNQVKAVDGVTVSFEGNGLFVILGKSGCGKSTLLSLISGLDKPTDGKMEFDSVDYSKYDSLKWDSFRNKHIGAIYQNYNLVGNLSVYRNLEIALNVAGLNEPLEINRRIDYALNLVGMNMFKNRRANCLSGGQQQRVGIARAIVTGSDIIIADEPTGNLDRENSIAVMDILKSLSYSKMVILVTHEEDLAYHYGDRIIRFNDGKIVDDQLNESNSSSIQGKQKVYLDQLNHTQQVVDENIKLDIYRDANTNEQINVTIVFSAGRVIIRNNVNDTNTDVVLLEKKEDMPIAQKVDTSLLPPIDGEYKSVFNVRSVLHEARLQTKAKKSKIRRLHLASLTLMSLVFVILTASFLGGVMFSKQNRFQFADDLVVVTEITYENVLEYVQTKTELSDDKVLAKQMEQTGSIGINLPNEFVQLSNYTTLPYTLLGKGDLAINEVVLGGMLVDRIEKYNFENNGIINRSYLIGERLSEYYAYDGTACKIVGIEENNQPVLYVSSELYDTLAPRNNETVLIYTEDPNTLARKMTNDGYKAYTSMDYSKKLYTKEISRTVTKKILSEVVVIALMCLCVIAVVSNSFVPKMKLVTVLRAVGVTKKDFDKYSLIYNLREALVSLIVGFLIGTFFVLYIIGGSGFLSKSMLYPWWIAILMLVFEVAVYAVANIAQIRFFVRKTPAELMSKYDL